MNLCMYCDDEKNLMMFLPDTVSDEEIMTLGEVVFPDDDGPAISTIFTLSFSAIWSAIFEIFFSCKASSNKTTSFELPS